MIRLLLTILLTSAICSCRSSKQSVTEYADTASVVVDETHTKLANDDILTLISASRELDVSGIKVEFYPPDSVHPDARAAPKSMTIENAKAKESTEQATHEQATVDEQSTVNFSAQSSADIAKDSRTYNDILQPSDRMLFFSILSAIIITLILLIKSRK